MPTESRSEAGAVARPKRRRTVVVLVLVGVALVVVVAFAVMWQRSGAHRVSTAEARRRYERSSPSTEPENPSLLRPPAGVYTYRGSGSERLSLPPKEQGQGPEMPGTVTHRADGCWTFRVDFSNQHWQTWIYCPRNRGLVELGGTTFERWDFVFTKYDSTSTFTCAPASVTIRAGMHAGQKWRQSCRGTSSGTKGVSVTSGPYTFVGDDTVVVSGTPVAAYRFRQVRTLSGSQSGHQTTELWFAKSDGLPLRNVRDVTVHTDTVVGSSTYTERGSFQLTSLQTQR